MWYITAIDDTIYLGSFPRGNITKLPLQKYNAVADVLFYIGSVASRTKPCHYNYRCTKEASYYS